MAIRICIWCGAPNEYDLDRPKFCVNCKELI